MPKVGSNGQQHNFAKLYEVLGIEFGRRSGDEAEGQCPFCDKDRFYVNVTNGLYHCKHCGEEGNPTAYLTQLHKEALEATTPGQYSALGRARGVAPQT